MQHRHGPRRARARWLEGAPRALLACYDNGGKTADRYTALYGEGHYVPDGRNMIPCRFMSNNPTHPQGVGIYAEVPAHMERRRLGRKVRFLDLPAEVQACIRRDCEDT